MIIRCEYCSVFEEVKKCFLGSDAQNSAQQSSLNTGALDRDERAISSLSWLVDGSLCHTLLHYFLFALEFELGFGLQSRSFRFLVRYNVNYSER